MRNPDELNAAYQVLAMELGDLVLKREELADRERSVRQEIDRLNVEMRLVLAMPKAKK